MSVKLSDYNEFIERFMENGSPVFRGAVTPEVHAYILRLKSHGYSQQEIMGDLRANIEGRL